MSVIYSVSLTLYCDVRTDPQCHGSTEIRHKDSKGAAKANAISNGWKVSSSRAVCPRCKLHGKNQR